ncbi:hypothetical protein SAMN05216561_103254 [Nocardioides psychrotolerans]|uniref:4-amino-4-deoxy-L-arabinose transferase n=1 Tax=Nocardioides psychrotolerans TaxID=1005945 RepID=A0A1I3E847_9ACTN|nr:hypothetical protein SAMN05216561_103254 [Nocardioides psychrotolerans]
MVGVALIALVTGAWHVWVAGQQTWIIDDWIYLDRVQTYGFVDYLVQDYNGHVMPGEFLLMWLLTQLFPMSFGAAVAVVGLLSVGAVVTWGLALHELFGPRLRQLVPLAVLSLSPLTLWPSAFWASAIQVLPLLLLTGVAIQQAARVAAGRRRAGWWLVGTYVVALLLWEKALLMLLPVAGVLIFLLGLRGLLRRRTLLAALGGVTAAYLALYAALRDGPVTAPVTWVDEGSYSFPVRVLHLLDYALGVLRDLAVPALYGGPWGSIPIVNDLEHRPPPLLSGTLTAVTVVLMVVGVLVRRRGWVPVLMTLGYAFVASFLILFSIKYAVLGPYALYEDRYFTDLLPVSVLAVSLLICPTRLEVEAGEEAFRSLPAAPKALVSGAGVLLALAAVVSLVVGNLTHWDRIGPNPARHWVDNLRDDLRAAPAGTSVRDARPPEDVFTASYYPEEGLISRMTASLDTAARFNEPGSPIQLVDASGHLVPATITPSVVSTVGPQPDCGYVLAAGLTAEVEIAQALFAYEWGVQVDMFSGIGGQVVVEVDGVSQEFAIPDGMSSTQLVHAGTVDTVTVTMPDAADTGCVTEVHAGELVPAS